MWAKRERIGCGCKRLGSDKLRSLETSCIHCSNKGPVNCTRIDLYPGIGRKWNRMADSNKSISPEECSVLKVAEPLY